MVGLIGLVIIVIGITTVIGSVSEVFLGVFLAFVLTSVLLPIVDWLDNFITAGPLPVDFSREEVTQGISNAVDAGTQYVQENATNIASMVATNVGQLAMIMTILALSVFVTACLLASGKEMWLWFLNRLPQRNRERVNLGAYAGWVAFSGYASGTVIIAIINGILAFLFLWALGIPLAAPLAVLVMIGTFIPLVGAPAAMIIAMIVALATEGVVMFAVVGLGIALIGQIEGNLLQPLIMGRQVSLHPALVAVIVAAGGFAGGLVGAVIAIPIAAIIWSVFRTLHEPDPELTYIPHVPKERVLPEDDDDEG